MRTLNEPVSIAEVNEKVVLATRDGNVPEAERWACKAMRLGTRKSPLPLGESFLPALESLVKLHITNDLIERAEHWTQTLGRFQVPVNQSICEHFLQGYAKRPGWGHQVRMWLSFARSRRYSLSQQTLEMVALASFQASLQEGEAMISEWYTDPTLPAVTQRAWLAFLELLRDNKAMNRQQRWSIVALECTEAGAHGHIKAMVIQTLARVDRPNDAIKELKAASCRVRGASYSTSVFEEGSVVLSSLMHCLLPPSDQVLSHELEKACKLDIALSLLRMGDAIKGSQNIFEALHGVQDQLYLAQAYTKALQEAVNHRPCLSVKPSEDSEHSVRQLCTERYRVGQVDGVSLAEHRVVSILSTAGLHVSQFFCP